jgi:propanediol utilization protein
MGERDMNYFSEKDIRDIVAGVISGAGAGTSVPTGQTVPVEISARHVHLTEEALSVLFGAGYQLSQKRDLSQPGQFLAQERVKLVTRKGEIDNVAVLGPARKQVQVELSLTDARSLGLNVPVNLSGDLTGGADVVIVGPQGIVEAKGAAIAARAHVHMTPKDAREYQVQDGQEVSIRLNTGRPITLDGVMVRVREDFQLAVHVDYDEANAASVSGEITGFLLKGR